MTEPKKLGQMLREAIQKTIDETLRSGPTNVASAVNVGTDGQSTSVYSDQNVTVIQHNGETRVIRHDAPGPAPDAPAPHAPAPASAPSEPSESSDPSDLTT
jgi:hypothetical protein